MRLELGYFSQKIEPRKPSTIRAFAFLIIMHYEEDFATFFRI